MSKSKTPKPTAHPSLKKASTEFNIKGRIHGTNHRLTDDEKAEAIALRKRDPKVFTLRRLAATYGLDTASMYYALAGGRAAIQARKERSAKRAKALKAKAHAKAA